MVPAWFHDGSEAVKFTEPYEFTGFLLGSSLVPRWFRSCKSTKPYEFTWFLLGSIWFHHGSDIANPRSPTNSQGSCLVPRWHGTFVIEGNFRTCLIQTGANCFLRFDFRGDERGVQGRGDGGGRFRLRWPPGLSAPSLQTPTWPRRALNMPENHSERWGASTERRRGLDPRVATWA